MTLPPQKRLRKQPMTIYVEREVRLQLQALSRRTRITQQTFLREGVAWVLARYDGSPPPP